MLHMYHFVMIYETSCPEVDVLVDEAWKIPALSDHESQEADLAAGRQLA